MVVAACARPVGYMPRQTHECDAAVQVRRHLGRLLVCDPLREFVPGRPWVTVSG